MRRLAAVLLLAGAAWVSFDLRPVRSDFRSFDGRAMGRLDAAMWRSYYERRPARLFWQLAASLRVQFHMPWVRSITAAVHAARAAFVFKDGRSRTEYARALPELERYFASINAVAAHGFDTRQAARDELEWWIIRREPAQHSTGDWEQLIAAVAARVYGIAPLRVAAYARGRVAAMVLRDERGDRMSEEDWSRISPMLEESWRSLGEAIGAGEGGGSASRSILQPASRR